MILLYSADNNGLSAISPHWMMGYSLINSGELTFAGFPHAYSDSSEDTWIWKHHDKNTARIWWIHSSQSLESIFAYGS